MHECSKKRYLTKNVHSFSAITLRPSHIGFKQTRPTLCLHFCIFALQNKKFIKKDNTRMYDNKAKYFAEYFPSKLVNLPGTNSTKIK